MTNTVELGTIDEARQFAAERSGPFLVMSPETLEQIKNAEAAGGFEGGMSGAAGEGGFSAPGSGGPDSSSASDPAPIDPGFTTVTVGVWIEQRLERMLTARDILEAVRGNPLGPILLVPMTELDRWLHGDPGPSA